MFHIARVVSSSFCNFASTNLRYTLWLLVSVFFYQYYGQIASRYLRPRGRFGCHRYNRTRIEELRFANVQYFVIRTTSWAALLFYLSARGHQRE